MTEANWYVVHTYSGYENKVKANIDKTIENRHLEDQILEVRVPLEDVTEVKNGVRKQVSKKMFPGYVLIHMIMNDDTWYVVRNTRGVWKDTVGVITAMNYHKQTVTINVELFGRETPVEVSFADVKKTN